MGQGAAETDVDATSTGYTAVCTWGPDDAPQLSVGTDFRYVYRELNDREIFRPAASQNFPIPPSFMANPGILFEYVLPAQGNWLVRTGGRFDFVLTDAENSVPGVGEGMTPILITDRLQTDRLDRNFSLWSWFVTGEWEFRENVTLTGAIGLAQRPPTLTELYSAGTFINLLQSGLTTLTGDPELAKERRQQVDLGLRWDYPRFHGSLTGYHAWIEDYITFDGGLLKEDQIGQKNNRVTLVNTDLATIAGGELFAAYDVTPMLETFVNMSYMEGRDHTRRKPSRIRGAGGDRSGVTWDEEPLPNIPAFETRLGLRLHSGDVMPELRSTVNGPARRGWSLTLTARMVDEQDREAYSLFERRTPGYTVWNLRGHVWLRERFLVTAGIDNLFDRMYRDHLDYRAGRGVFQPGITGYVGTEVIY